MIPKQENMALACRFSEDLDFTLQTTDVRRRAPRADWSSMQEGPTDTGAVDWTRCDRDRSARERIDPCLGIAEWQVRQTTLNPNA